MPIQDHVSKQENIAIVTDEAINEDIRDTLEKDFLRALKQWKPGIKKIFLGKNEKETANLIWLFLRKHCKYRRDPERNQIIRLPSFWMNQQPRLGDCKTFALNSRSLFAYLYPGNETAFKFTGYFPGATRPTHVYTVVKDKNGNEIIIDGCYNHFDSEKKYTLALPLKFKRMRITSLSGNDLTPAQILNGMNDKLPQAQRERIKKLCALRNKMNAARAEFDGGHINREEFRNRISEIKGEIPVGKLTPEQAAARKKKRKAGAVKFGRAMATIHLAPLRGAFLAILAISFNAMAHKMKKIMEAKDQTQWKKIVTWWKNFGGFEKMLRKVIIAGAKHKPVFLSKKAKEKYNKNWSGIKGFEEGYWIGDSEEINAAHIAIPAIVAMATPLIASLIPILMKALGALGHKKDAGEVATQGQEIVAADRRGESYQQAFKDNEGTDMNPEPGSPEDSQQAQDNQDMNDLIEGINDGGDWASILGQVAGKGVEALTNVIRKKAAKNPKAAKVLESGGQAADDYFTGRYMRDAGYTQRLKQVSSAAGGVAKYLPWVFGAAAVAYALKKK